MSRSESESESEEVWDMVVCFDNDGDKTTKVYMIAQGTTATLYSD